MGCYSNLMADPPAAGSVHPTRSIPDRLADPLRPAYVRRNDSSVLLAVRGSSNLLPPVGLAALLDLFVLLLLRVAQDCLNLAVAVLANAV
jgi:hypothetical protein